MGENIIRFPGTDEVEPGGIGAGHVPLVRLGEGVDALSIGGLVNALAALAHRAQRRRGCPSRLVRPRPNPGTLAYRLSENRAGWSKRPGQEVPEIPDVPSVEDDERDNGGGDGFMWR